MIRDIQENKTAYSILAVASGAFLLYFLGNQHRPILMYRAVIVFAVFYVLWGFFHHKEDNSLTTTVMLEYILVAALAVLIASTLLL